MSEELRTTRLNNNSVLFTFSAIADIPLGIIMALRRDNLSGGSPFLDYSFLSLAPKDIQRARLEIGKGDIIERCFKEEYKDKASLITKAYYHDALSLSPVTSALPLIRAYNQYGKDIKITLCSDKDEEVETLRKMFRDAQVKIQKFSFEDKHFDINQFGRVVLGEIKDLDKLANPPKLRHITVLNYGSNLELVDEKVALLSDYVIRYGDINEFELIDAFPNL